MSSGHKTNVQDIMYLKEKEKRRYKNPHYIPKNKKNKNKNTPPNKNISYTNSPSKYMTTLIPKTTPPFCHE